MIMRDPVKVCSADGKKVKSFTILMVLCLCQSCYWQGHLNYNAKRVQGVKVNKVDIMHTNSSSDISLFCIHCIFAFAPMDDCADGKTFHFNSLNLSVTSSLLRSWSSWKIALNISTGLGISVVSHQAFESVKWAALKSTIQAAMLNSNRKPQPESPFLQQKQ